VAIPEQFKLLNFIPKKLRKLCINELQGVKMKKNENKTCFAVRKNVFSLLIFWAGPLALHFKDDFV